MEKITIPLFIINFNRLKLLKKQLNFFKTIKDVDLKIIIVDNNSSYPKLLKFYEQKFNMKNKLPIHNGYGNYYESKDGVILFKSNHNKVECGPWNMGVIQSFIYDGWVDTYQKNFDAGVQCCGIPSCGIELLSSDNKTCKVCVDIWEAMKIKHPYYIVTDVDLTFNGIPTDFISKYITILEEHPSLNKVGTGFPSDDIPEWNPLKDIIKRQEGMQYGNPIENSVGMELYNAGIDTTFALYRSDDINRINDKRCTFPVTSHMTGVMLHNSARSLGKYSAKHTPWYINPIEDEEENYYLRHAAGGWTSSHLHQIKEFFDKVKKKEKDNG